MEHRMKLHEHPFRAIMQGRKNIELRLFDGKRQQLKTGDTIVFTLVDSEEKISAKISALYRADSFAA